MQGYGAARLGEATRGGDDDEVAETTDGGVRSTTRRHRVEAAAFGGW